MFSVYYRVVLLSSYRDKNSVSYGLKLNTAKIQAD